MTAVNSLIMMAFRFKYHLCGLLLALSASVALPAWSKSTWEPLKSEPSELKTIIKETEVELKTSSGTIVITTSHQVQVKVFTILGQLVSSETIGPGIVRLTLNAHGVYIIKIGDRTCKVAL